MTRTSLAFCVLIAALLVGCEMPFGTEPGGGDGSPPELVDQIEIEKVLEGQFEVVSGN